MAEAHAVLLAEREANQELDEDDYILEWDQWKHLTRVIEEPEAAPRWVSSLGTGIRHHLTIFSLQGLLRAWLPLRYARRVTIYR
jgi:hypothetical protein